MNEAVRLNCVKPSNLATLTWTSSQFKILPKKLFIQSADGSLNFLANTVTFGTYCCEAEEGGHKEVVTSYEVQQVVSPRSISPPEDNDVSDSPDESNGDENIVTEEPTTSTIPTLGDPEDYAIKNKGGESVVTEDRAETNKEEPKLKNAPDADGLGSTPTSRRGVASCTELLDLPEDKSYYSELVVVSLLLATCICILILTGLHMWHQRKTNPKLDGQISPEDGSKVNKSMESIPSLSWPEDAGPELKVVE